MHQVLEVGVGVEPVCVLGEEYIIVRAGGVDIVKTHLQFTKLFPLI